MLKKKLLNILVIINGCFSNVNLRALNRMLLVAYG